MEDFVSFETAKKLKEKGFSCKYPFAIYFGNRMYFDYDDLIDDKDAIIAPTISQVLKWLRKEKKISIEPGIHCSLKWVCGIYGFNDGIDDFTSYSNDVIDDTVCILYDSYEQAALAGIEYVLDNLI